jgi:hypothetical protein
MVSDKKADLLALCIVSLVSLLATLPLWTPGVPNPNDFLISAHRVLELENAWQQGVYFPRFGLDLNFGYSAPLFQFYPPLASYLAIILRWLGFGYIAGTKSVLVISMLIGTIGVFVYGRYLLRNRVAAVVAALVYAFSPYLLIVVYERGAVAESLAWALLPWLMWSVNRLYDRGDRISGLLAALFVALIIVGHNATAMFIIPGVALFAFLLSLIDRRPKAILPVAGAFVLGAGLSAFYWMPAILELGYSHTRIIMFNETTDVVNNTVSFANLIQHSLVHQFVGEDRFRFSLWQFFLGLASLIFLLTRRRSVPSVIWLLAIAWAVVLILQTELSLPFWQHMPMVDSIQFPWRLYGVASFCVSMLIGAAAMVLDTSIHTRRTAWFVGIGIAISIVFGLSALNAVPGNSWMWTPMEEADINRDEMWKRGLSGYPLFEDYTVSSIEIGLAQLASGRTADDPTRLAPTTAPEITVLAENPIRYELGIKAVEPWTLRLHRPYFPGWQVYLDGKRVPAQATGVAAVVTAELPAGEYSVLALFGNSTVRTIANLMTIMSIAIWLTLLMRKQRGWMDLIYIGLLTLIVGTGIWYLTGPGRQSISPVKFESRFENGMTLLGFKLADEQICVGGETQLRLYWIADATPETDLKYFIHVRTLDDAHTVAQYDTMPFSGYNPTTRWEAGELIVDEQALELDESIETGRYQLLIGLYDPVTMQNQIVTSSPDMLPGDRLKLAEIELTDCSDQ